MHRWLRRRVAAATLIVLTGAGTLSACGGGSDDAGGSGATQVKLGFFPNITHATALVGTEKGIFARHLGVPPKTSTFNAGPAAVEALFAKGIDATFIGPNPAINAWAKSKGKAIKIISGAASGGVLVHPITVGSGRRLFPDAGSDLTTYRLTGSTTTGTGVIIATYEPAEADRAGIRA